MSEEGDDHQGEEEPGQDLEQLGQPHQDGVHAPAVEARHGPDQDADAGGGGGGQEADEQGNPGAVEHAAIDVPPEVVGSHEVGRIGRLEGLRADLERVGGGQNPSQERDQHEPPDDGQAGGCGAVSGEPPPEIGQRAPPTPSSGCGGRGSHTGYP